MRWSPGGSSGALACRRTRIAGLCCAVLLAALMPAARAEAARQDADVTLGYACRLSSGPQQVTVRIKGSFPAQSEPSAAIQPSDVAVTVTFPRDAAGEVLGADAATVTGSARLGVLAGQADRPVGTEWTDLPIASTDANRPLRITASGPVPSSTAGTEGDVVFSAGVLVLRLEVRKSDGTPATPAPVALECVPNLGQATTLVTVPLAGDAGNGEPGARGAQAPGTGAPGASAGGPRTLADDFCPPPPDPPEFNPDLPPFPPIPDGAILSGDPQHACATIDGRSNVNKLKGAAPLRGVASVIAVKEQWALIRIFPPPIFRYVQQRHIARADLIPTEATFLTFGFMPTTAKMEITQIGNMNIAVETGNFSNGEQITTGWAHASIRVSDVRVNGSPLDVGPNCRTVGRMLLVVNGRSDNDPPYTLDSGGQLTGTVKIPQFTGCGTGGDDLDRLLTASISGPGNFVRLFQGALCKPADGNTTLNPCPPGAYGLTITPGGEFRGTLAETSPPAVIRLGTPPAPSVTCSKSTITGNLRSGPQIPPQHVGEVTGLNFSDCAGSGTLEGANFTITSNGGPATIQNTTPGTIPPSGDMNLQIRLPSLRVESDFCSLEIRPLGANATTVGVQMTYNTVTHRLQLTGISSGVASNPSNGCPSGDVLLAQGPSYEGIVQNIRFGGEQPPLP